MKVLVIARHDSPNLNILNVLRELERRGHQLTIFDYYGDKANNWMLRGLKAEFRPSDELTPEVVKEFDIAFCADSMADLKYQDIYCFAMDWSGIDFIVAHGGDFLFTTYSSQERLSNHFRCASMAIGVPKNDTLVTHPDTETKRILYIDSGHSPYGYSGKSQLADMLLEICAAFPEYEICVKPRWLLADMESGRIDYTHKNGEHIYTVINERCNGVLPDNLNLLQEHRDLQALIDSSVSVITLYSSTSSDVVLRDKGLLIVTGYDSEETFENRAQFIENMHGHFVQSGCAVDYREVVKYLPDGLQAKQSYMDKYFPYRSGASERAVDVMEYVYEHFLQHGMYPEPTKYTYETFAQQMKADSTITMDRLRYERIRSDSLCEKFEYSIMRGIPSAKVDFSEFYAALDETYTDYPLSREDADAYQFELNRLETLIMEKQKDQWKGDPFDEEYWFRRLWEGRMEDKLLQIPETEVENKIAYHYFLGRVCRKKKMVNEAMAHFYAFVMESPPRPYPKYYSEQDRAFRRAYTYLFSNYNGVNLQASQFVDVCFSFYERGNMNLIDDDMLEQMCCVLRDMGQNLETADSVRATKCCEICERIKGRITK